MGVHKKFILEDLPAEWYDLTIELMSQGAAVIEVLRAFNLKGYTREIHARMMVDYPEYKEAFEQGKILCEAWWTEIGRLNLHYNKFNNAMWIFNMKNRFAWRDTPLSPTEKAGDMFTDKMEQAEFLQKYKVEPNKVMEN
jgi:hypothetical protein